MISKGTKKHLTIHVTKPNGIEIIGGVEFFIEDISQHEIWIARINNEVIKLPYLSVAIVKEGKFKHEQSPRRIFQ